MRIIEFKDPTEEDISKNLNKYNWCITLGDKHNPMQLCRIDGCYHTIGGRYGNNCLYAYPIDEEPTPGNLDPFNGEIPWSYTVSQTNYYRKDDIRCNTFCKIYRAGEQVYEFSCGWDLMPHKIMMVINDLKELPFYINEISYETKYLLDRKVYYKDMPGIVTMYMKEQGAVYITFESGGGVKEDILAQSINWFRD